MSERNHIFSGEVFPYRMYWKMKKKMNMTFEMMTYSDNDDWKQARSSHSNYILRSLRSEPEQDVTTILMWWYIIDISFEIWTQFQTYHTIWQDSALKGSPTTGTGYVLRMVWADVLWVRCREKYNIICLFLLITHTWMPRFLLSNQLLFQVKSVSLMLSFLRIS